MVWKILAREIGIVLVMGASKAFYEYMKKQDPKQIIDMVVEKPGKKGTTAKSV